LFVKRTQDNDLRRAEGCGRMVLGGAQSGARIVELFQRSPIRILFPRAGDGALEEAVPQEAISFNCARLSRQTEIELSSGAQLLALEWLVLGRAAHGEHITGGHITDSWRVRKDGRLIWADCFRVTDETFTHLGRKALLSNCRAIGTLIFFGPDLDMRLEFLRNIARFLRCHCAATCVSGLIVVRFAAKLASDLRQALRRLIERFGEELGFGPFRVPKMWP
jgi:urease accessory protein